MTEEVSIDFGDRCVTGNVYFIRKFQALWRGHAVRKRMLKLREAYAEIYVELEKEPHLQLYWSNGCCRKPLFLRSLEYERKIKEDQERKEAEEKLKERPKILSEEIEVEQKQNPMVEATVIPSGKHSQNCEDSQKIQLEPDKENSETGGDFSRQSRELSDNITDKSDNENIFSDKTVEQHKTSKMQVIEKSVNGEGFKIGQTSEFGIESESSEISKDVAKSSGKSTVVAKEDTESLNSGTNGLSSGSEQGTSGKSPRNETSTGERSELPNMQIRNEIGHRNLSNEDGYSVQSESDRDIQPITSSNGGSDFVNDSHSRNMAHPPHENSDPKNSVVLPHQQTSCWDSQIGDEVTVIKQELAGLSKEELQQQRSTIAMELLWVQQALESRKQYLRLKTNI